jgi:hypothetical protein
LRLRDWPVPFDVWWFRLPRAAGAEYSLIPRRAAGRLPIIIPWEGYFQIGALMPKGGDSRRCGPVGWRRLARR